jgi:hypothetical protein
MPEGAGDEPCDDSPDEEQEKKADADPGSKHEPPHPDDHKTP